jgi:DnaK suppressor protein
MKAITTRVRTRLGPKHRAYLRAKLLERRRMLLAQLHGEYRKLQAPVNEGPGGDVLDLAQESQEMESSYQLAEIEARSVEEIETAIHRLDDGTYGLCEHCGRPIPPARLEALPSAVLCVKCKSEQETDGGDGADLRYDRLRDTPDESYDPERVFGTVRGRKVT